VKRPLLLARRWARITGCTLPLVDIGFDEAGINREAVTADEPGLNTGAHHAFKDAAQRSAFAKPLVPGA